MMINNQIIGLILIEFQNALKELNLEYDNEKSEKYGVPPSSAIVKYHNKFDIKGYKLGNIVSAWKINLSEVQKIEDLECKANLYPVSGMFYSQGCFLFSINQDITQAIIEWQVGPRYGRGYLYSIDKRENEITIIKIKDLWVS